MPSIPIFETESPVENSHSRQWFLIEVYFGLTSRLGAHLPAFLNWPGHAMAPKKKARLPSRAASTPSADAGELPASETATPPKPDTAKKAFVTEAWTDEQDTSLLKSVVRWKPVGSFYSSWLYQLADSIEKECTSTFE